jgi:hypothetical protein
MENAMRDFLASRRRFGSRHGAAAAAMALLSASASAVYAGVDYDNLITIENDTTKTGGFGVTPANDTFIGGAFTLSPKATDITGFDLVGDNMTSTNFTDVEVFVYVWGTVNTGTVDTSHPAFSNLLNEYGYDLGPAAANSVIDLQYLPGAIPDLPVSPALQLSGSTTIGLTVNYMGSTDNVNYASVTGLTSYLSESLPPSPGSNPLPGFYRNNATETDGNFVSALRNVGNTPYLNLTATIYGDIPAVTYQWNSPSGGSWETAANWNPAGVPSSSDIANFNLSANPVTAPGYSVSINTATDAVETLNIESDKVTFAMASTNTTSSQLSVVGTLTVAQPPANASGTTYGFLNIINAGSGTRTYVEPNSIVVGPSGGIGQLNIGSGVLVNNATSVTIGAGSSLILQKGAILITPTLNIAGFFNNWTGTVDITASALDLPGSNLLIVNSQVASGYNQAGGAKWNGPGITSSTAAADSRHITAVGVIQNNQSGSPLYGSGGSIAPIFDGFFSPAAGDILVKYTYFGDANLDGKVDGSDYSLIDNGYINGLSGWYNGDFNYDGTIDGSDYALIDNAFNNQSLNTSVSPDIAILSPGSGGSLFDQDHAASPLSDGEDLIATTNAQIAPAAVPEPAGIAGLVLATAAFFGRAKRRLPRVG